MELRSYQTQAIQMIREALMHGEKPVLQLPTGGGKTAIASEIAAMTRAKGNRIGFCVPYLSLISQTWKAFLRAGMDEREMGVIQADNPLTNWSAPIQICSVDTLVRRKVLPKLDVVIFDEAHRQSKLYARWMEEAPATRFIALSATPWAKGMRSLWDVMLTPTTVAELIEQGYLAPFRYYAPASPNLEGVKIRAGDYAEDQLAEAMNKPLLVADIVRTWLERAERRRTFVFAVDRAHAQHIQRQFIEAGVRAEYIDAYTPVKERDRMLEQLAAKQIDMITSVGCLTTGVDCPVVDCMILARPTRSEMLYMQMVGRVLRTAQGKTDALILDHSDTGLSLGLPDEIAYSDFIDADPTGERAPRQKREPLPKKCAACGYLKPAKVHQCPACGFAPEARSCVEAADGDLEELGRGGKRVRGEKATKDEKQEFWSEMLWYVQERGYKRGWASNKYREKFGVWPQGLRDHAVYPRQSTFGWVKSRQIAWSKANARVA